MPINFFTEEVSFSLKEKRKRKAWLKNLAESENHIISDLNFVFCSDEYLLNINVEYLDHDTYTDIITFDNSEEKGIIEGDIFISIERVKENSKTLKTEEENELSRVLSHGLFHLLGYKDKLTEEESLMRSKEEFAIDLFEKI
ncbi:rRNA maturation RNase YbeY [Algoriphagus ratkowskyi]|uniref:Endoribonuclease YbeY n=1 Tax=Algoriphagus ratkowskyi TaxID=57028 RepID=A0A2W7RIW2_9BACT|nr:rRNA maturation RNase YbeY [Algoriphagus ratkowskyi]PZX58350.1 rRNA maturation RNase YbeY [Algoriphagus ratkowskyi]TXD77779.1 rRNA maturation RNase YbeY [Algoriphagus ratkowskyi]